MVAAAIAVITVTFATIEQISVSAFRTTIATTMTTTGAAATAAVTAAVTAAKKKQILNYETVIDNSHNNK